MKTCCRILLLMCFTLWGHAQMTIRGVVTDKQSTLPVAYATVGIKDKPIGTVCDEKGVFELNIPAGTSNDSLKFSAIGYKSSGFAISHLSPAKPITIELKPEAVQLTTVNVKPGKSMQKILGVQKFNKTNCSAYGGEETNWKGQESAIMAHHSKGQTVYMEDFNFYIIKNTLNDSLTFRLNFYKARENGMPGDNLMNRSIVFKTAVKEGPVKVNLKDYFIHTDEDFFISLECLEDKINMKSFCFSGEVSEPSYVRVTKFMKWSRIRGGGLAFNVTVSYVK
ncbi:MAG: carboxypeptidase-like regulatory domain-containing protein [Bacteroidetes bacterium]|nr:carboxypeptidase-like regulatory domain-containing protein [Bacteroidota bacterium]